MSPQRFADILQILGLRVRAVAKAFDVKDITVRHWRSGQADIPPLVAGGLEALAAEHSAAPFGQHHPP